MESSLQLVSEANRFLDSVSLSENASEAEIGRLLEANIKAIRSLKDQMVSQGFNAPFIGLLQRRCGEEYSENPLESVDFSKQVDKMRYNANLKKFTLNRMRVALAAHEAASKFASSSFRKDIIPLFPLDGNYISRLVRIKDHGIHAYNSLLESLGSGRRSQVVSVAIEFEKDGKVEQAKLKFSSSRNIEQRIRRAYGDSAKIVSQATERSSEPVFKRKSARVCISAAYASLAALQTEKAMRPEKHDENLERMISRYSAIMKRHGLEETALVDQVEGYYEVKEELASSGIMSKEKSGFALNESLASHLSRRKNALSAQSEKRAKELLAFDLFKYFLMTPRRDREQKTLFPSLPAVLPKESLGLLGSLESSEHSIPDAAGILEAKIKAEELQLSLDGRTFGCSFFFLSSGKSLEWCENAFGCPAKDILEGASLLAPLVEARPEKLKELGIEKTERGRLFSELVKNAGPQGNQE